eukprot:SAG31_NODE_1051_length_10157_cov_203.009048_7_plen_48_part_00
MEQTTAMHDSGANHPSTLIFVRLSTRCVILALKSERRVSASLRVRSC